jgi:hypothetical protein
MNTGQTFIIFDSVNRTQTRILEAIGRPAQDGIMKELLESQKDILGIVGLMCQVSRGELHCILTTIRDSKSHLFKQTKPTFMHP